MTPCRETLGAYMALDAAACRQGSRLLRGRIGIGQVAVHATEVGLVFRPLTGMSWALLMPWPPVLILTIRLKSWATVWML
jgi:hypothetical protein